MIRGLPQALAERIVECRGDRPCHSPDGLARRAGLSSAVLQRLSRADAFRSLSLDRRQALWRSLPPQEHPPLLAPTADVEPETTLPPLSAREDVAQDIRTTG